MFVAKIWLRILNIQATYHQVTLMQIWKSASAINEGRWYMINNVCSLLGIFFGTWWHILIQHLNMRQMAVNFVPCVLNDDQQLNWHSEQTLARSSQKDGNFLHKPWHEMNPTGRACHLHVQKRQAAGNSSQGTHPSRPNWIHTSTSGY